MKKCILPALILCFVLIQCGSPDIQSLEEKAQNGSKSAAEELIKIMSTNKDSNVRADAAAAIGNAKIKSANAQLLKSFEADDDNVRKEIVLSLGKIGVAENYNLVISTLKSDKEKEEVRNKALESIGYFKTDAAVNVLVAALADQDSNKKNIAITSLGFTESPKAVQPLINILKEQTTNDIVAKSLYNLKQKSSFADILAILEKKIDTYEYDNVFMVLTKLLTEAKYTQHEKVLAKAFLSGPDENKNLKKELIKDLKALNIKTSYCVITASSLNVRSKPNTRGDVIGTIEAGDLATILEVSNVKHQIEGKEDFWYRVRTNKGKEGWIFGSYLKILDYKHLPEDEE